MTRLQSRLEYNALGGGALVQPMPNSAGQFEPARGRGVVNLGRRCLASTTGQIVLFALATLTILVLRRPDQFLHAAVWDEEGTRLLPEVYAEGVRSFLTTVNGYLVTIPRLITFVSLPIGGLANYPEVSTILGVSFTIAALAYMAFTPTRLRYPKLLAFSVVLLPTNCECLVVPLYTFWFAGLLLLALLFREHGSPKLLALDLLLATLCGLSSPIVFVFVPLMALRLLCGSRTRGDWAFLLVGLLGAGTQLWCHASASNYTHPFAGQGDAVATVQLFFCKLYAWFLEPVYAAGFEASVRRITFIGVSIFAFLAAACVRKRSYVLLALLLLANLTFVLGAARVGVQVLDPHSAGPRYFFYPWIFIMWLLIQILVAFQHKLIRCACGVILIMFFMHYGFSWRRDHDRLDWQAAVRTFQTTGSAVFPVHADGDAAKQWSVTLRRLEPADADAADQEHP